MAREMGVDVVELDLARPFTAARARNEGFQKLIQDSPELKYVQFVDGDCEIDPAWIGKASKFLKENNTVSVACGRRAERYPDKTIYNFLCDMEWNTPIGEAKSCGGDALMLVEAIKEVGGYNNDLIAGEEPELCYRLRHKGWRVWRIDEEMTLHDADLTRFSQWWVRAIRSGHAYAEGAYMYGLQEERFRVREIGRIMFWGLSLPILILIGAAIEERLLYLFILYPIQVIRTGISGEGARHERWISSIFFAIGKFPEAYGMIKFFLNRLLRKRATIIEYK